MEQRHFIIEKGRLKELPNHKDLGEKSSRRGQNWFDFQISDREELGEALEKLDPHPIILDLALQPGKFSQRDLLRSGPADGSAGRQQPCNA